MKRILCLLLAALLLVLPSFADLPNPSTLRIIETDPGRFQVELTLPLVNGQVASLRPMLPEGCVVDPNPVSREDIGLAIRTWTMTCDPRELSGKAFSIDGLLGSSFQVLFTLETLDGRTYSRQLHATRTFFVVPHPPTVFSLFRDSFMAAARRFAGFGELILLLAALTFLLRRPSVLLLFIAAFALSQGIGQWLAGLRFLGWPGAVPRLGTAVLAWILAMELRDTPVLPRRWYRPLPVLACILGMLYGGAFPDTIPADGLSDAEFPVTYVFYALGVLAVLLLAAAGARQIRPVMGLLPEKLQDRAHRYLAGILTILSLGTVLYLSLAPLLGSGGGAILPLSTWAAAAALGLLAGAGLEKGRPAFALIVALAWGLGIAFGHRLQLSWLPVFLYGLPALIAWVFVTGRRLPDAVVVALGGLTVAFQGIGSRTFLEYEPVRLVQSAVGSGVLLAAVVYLVFLVSRTAESRRAKPLGIAGYGILLITIIYQLVEIVLWIRGPVGRLLTLGYIRIPLAGLILILLAAIMWPRRRRFAPDTPNAGTPRTHLLLLISAFFILPFGTVRSRVPFHQSRAPETAEARNILGHLLEETYLAFNRSDDNQAFDQLEQVMARDLIDDVYLDSRRRLLAGIREGSEVAVREVAVSVDSDGRAAQPGVYEYACQWIVTARVRHRQHVHDRRNRYDGIVTIGIEDGRWKIAALELVSESQTVLSRTGP